MTPSLARAVSRMEFRLGLSLPELREKAPEKCLFCDMLFEGCRVFDPGRPVEFGYRRPALICGLSWEHIQSAQQGRNAC